MIRRWVASHRTLLGAGAALALICALAWASGLRFQESVASAAELEAETWHTCTPANVAAFTSRIHVKCAAAAAGGIWYFAFPTRDAAGAARYLSLLSTALVAGKQVQIFYDTTDTSGASYGCATSDCRPIRAVGLLP